MDAHLDFTEHGDLRAAQRNLSDEEITLIFDYGIFTHRTGAVFVYFRERDIPKESRRDQRIRKLIGSTVLIDNEYKKVITVYRNADAPKKDRRKSRYHSNKRDYL